MNIYDVVVAGTCLCVVIMAVRYVATSAEADEISAPRTFDLIAHLDRQHAFSQRTFGPGERTTAVLAHIRKELNEVEAQPSDLMEWTDLLLLTFDGALRAGFTPAQIADALTKKLTINEQRTWPDWRNIPPDQPIEHTKKAAEQEPRELRFTKEWLKGGLADDVEEPGNLATNPNFFDQRDTPAAVGSVPTLAEVDYPELSREAILAQEMTDLTDDLMITANALRRTSEAQALLIAEQAKRIEALKAR